ncbi:MAG TPA: PH domain-containing protein [Bacteroidia bacterium]|nr:PH domain-containing protein [Bacteroidia bacterium]
MSDLSDESYPLEDGIFVLKGGRKLGPFTVEDLLDGLESGDFSPLDVCLREGATDCERLRDLLDWQDDDEEGLDEPDESEELAPAPEPPAPKTANPNRLLYAGHPSILTFPWSLLALVGGVTGGIWIYPVDGILTLAGIGIAVAGLARISLARFSQDYHIRPRRIEVTSGLVVRSSREVRISDVRSINVSCRGLAGILGIGSVEFLTSGDLPEITFRNIWAAQRVKALVRRLQDAG